MKLLYFLFINLKNFENFVKNKRKEWKIKEENANEKIVKMKNKNKNF